MATSKMKDLVGKNKAELLSVVTEYKRELMNLRFQKTSGQLENTARFREVRVAIARAYTEINKGGK
jgi:large subunit ribosomal protein L29